MPHAAVVQRERSRRAGEIRDLRLVDARDVRLAQASGPASLRIVLQRHRLDVVTARQHAERPIVHATVVQIGANGKRRIIGMGPEADVVMPLHFFAALRPLEVELRVMELDVRADEIGDDVADRRVHAVVPEQGMLLHRIRYAAQAWRVGLVAGLEIVDFVGLAYAPPALDELVPRAACGPSPQRSRSAEEGSPRGNKTRAEPASARAAGWRGSAEGS